MTALRPKRVLENRPGGRLRPAGAADCERGSGTMRRLRRYGWRERALAWVWVALVSVAGCGHAQQAHFVSPEARLDPSAQFYVVGHEGDDWQVGHMIARWLEGRGLRVREGPREDLPADADVMVLYEDHWMWDMTMYMLSLKVDLRDARTNVLLASGQSYRTSLYRKSPEEVVGEVLSGVVPSGIR